MLEGGDAAAVGGECGAVGSVENFEVRFGFVVGDGGWIGVVVGGDAAAAAVVGILWFE